MQNAELITLLAYLEHQDVTLNDLKNILHIELRTDHKQKRNEITQIRISFHKSKGAITSFLKRIEEGSKEEEEFIESIEKISEFGDKLRILEGDEEGRLLRIFNPNTDRKLLGKKNDFYLLYLILKELDLHVVLTYRKDILESLEEIYKLTKDMPMGKNENDFIWHVNEEIAKYKKYSK